MVVKVTSGWRHSKNGRMAGIGFCLSWLSGIEKTQHYDKSRFSSTSFWRRYCVMKEIKTPLNIKMIEVRDTHGKNYRYPARWPWSRSKFRKQIEQEWTHEQREYWESQLKET